MGQLNPLKPAVLVVEDDALIRMEAVDLCEEAGYRVYEARTAAEALKLLEAHGDIQILFTDVEMPGDMDGLKLAQDVSDRWPPIRIMVTSGKVKVGADDLPSDGLFFAKPYRPAGIVLALKTFADQIRH